MGMLGLNAKVYWRSGGTYGAPVWTDVNIFSDVSVNPAWDEASADARESRIKQVRKTLLGLEITGRMKKKIGNTAYDAFMNAMLSDEVLDIMVLDGSNTTDGVRGWRFDAQVFSATEDQAMGNVLYEEMILKPSLDTNAPLAVKVAGGVPTYYAPGGAVPVVFA